MCMIIFMGKLIDLHLQMRIDRTASWDTPSSITASSRFLPKDYQKNSQLLMLFWKECPNIRPKTMDRSPTIFRTIKQNSGSDTTGSFRETWGEALPRLYHTMLPVSSPKVWAQERPQAPVDSFPKAGNGFPQGLSKDEVNNVLKPTIL